MTKRSLALQLGGIKRKKSQREPGKQAGQGKEYDYNNVYHILFSWFLSVAQRLGATRSSIGALVKANLTLPQLSDIVFPVLYTPKTERRLLMSRYSFFSYNTSAARRWTTKYRLNHSARAVNRSDPAALVVRALLQDAGSAEPDTPSLSEIATVSFWLYDCPVASFITSFVRKHGRELMRLDQTLLASQILQLGSARAACDFALYVPQLPRAVQRKLRRKIDNAGNPRLLYVFDRDVKINSR